MYSLYGPVSSGRFLIARSGWEREWMPGVAAQSPAQCDGELVSRLRRSERIAEGGSGRVAAPPVPVEQAMGKHVARRT